MIRVIESPRAVTPGRASEFEFESDEVVEVAVKCWQEPPTPAEFRPCPQCAAATRRYGPGRNSVTFTPPDGVSQIEVILRGVSGQEESIPVPVLQPLIR